MTRDPITRYLAATVRRAAALFWLLVKVIVPIMLLVRVGETVGAIDWLGTVLGPFMVPLGLPPETAIAYIACALIGPPAGLAAIAVLDVPLTMAQASTLGSMMLIAHGLPLECSIVARAGGSFAWSLALRVGGSFVYGALVAALFALTGWLSGPADLSALSAPTDTSWAAWARASLELLATIGIVLLALLVLLDAMERVGLTALLRRLLAPLLAASGLDAKGAGREAAPLVTIGLLLGLTYGAGLIIEASRRGTIPPAERNITLAWLCLSHSVIEDTALILLMGASLWPLLLGRLLFTVVAVRLLAPVIRARSGPALTASG